ncbi:MAG TPA: hypothetical protein H9708_05935 [Candidatus Borkfalkia stercoripullorum]|nr:hypothetical protein [Candidatus Borkfalkia stercoripullorum]
MSRKSVAVLCVGSSEITALTGARGVNNTFVFKGIHTEKYDGYADAQFFDPSGLKSAVFSALEHMEISCGAKTKKIYVGVPGEFVTVVTKRHLISFQRKRRIVPSDIDVLYRNGFEENRHGEFIRRGSIYFVTSDKRRIIDPVGMVSDSLEGYLSYFYADPRFTELFRNIMAEYGIHKVEFLPVSLAEALYLIPSEVRDEYAILLDIGYMSMTFGIVCGNGVVFQRSASVGGGHVAAHMIEDIDIPFEAAEAILKKVNLSSTDVEGSVIEYSDKEETYSVPAAKVKEKVKEGLDIICEAVNSCLEQSGGRYTEYKPVLLTGEGVTSIRGAREHISGRLNKVVEILAPRLPYYNKPAQSSLLSILDMALRTEGEQSFIHKLFYGFGG